MIHQEAAFLGFLDCFWLLSCACMIGVPLVFFTPIQVGWSRHWTLSAEEVL
jgi:hypothetical protein